MKRKTPTKKTLQALSALVSRANLAARLGLQYEGDRDIYRALGYPVDITYADRVVRYKRQDIASAVVNRPVNACWNGGVLIQESTKEDTPLEMAWVELTKRKELALLPKLQRLDTLSCLGEYAVLLLGFSDVKTQFDYEKPVESRALDLTYIRPVGEGNASITEWDTNTSSSRFGFPVMYSLDFTDAAGNEYSIRAHYSRILHVARNLLEGNVKGMSDLDCIWNRLIDLEKLVGGSAEMFWRGARPGYKAKLDDEYTLGKDDEAELQDQLDEYEHNLRRFLISRGIDLQALEQQLADPTSHIDAQIQMISAATGIPKRILVGSERGELASTQDQEAWSSLIESRRDNFVGPEIVRPFIDICIEHGILPPPKEDYVLIWKSMFEQSARDRAEVGQIRATALREYASQPTAEMIVPPDAFYRFFLGLDEDEISLITEIQESTEKEMIEEPEEEEIEEESEESEEIET